ncbi:MAG: zinc ribbon domain-containing protein [Candidatus Rokubacteria bacterium]|nr:zinc ribbon domain-containing protein [Candidatus Rokubacteria bacterium]
MPTYEYQCDKCQRISEVRQRISEPALTTCDVCGGALRRLLSAAPFILKGEGWYVTDYPSEGRKKAREAEKGSSSAEKSSTPSSTSESSGSGASEKTPPATTSSSSAE